MKKLLMLLLLILGIGAAGAGYYIFYYMPNHGDVFGIGRFLGEKPQTPPAEPESNTPTPVTAPEEKKEIMDYYVSVATLPIRSEPNQDAFVEERLHRGDQVNLLEKTDGWGRITEYFVYVQDQPATAKWIPLDGLVIEKPVITPQQRKETVLGYINRSDDLGKYEATFFNTTNELLISNQCKPKDFEETYGWVRAVSFQDRDVYFVYCGGLDRLHKIYLDASNGQIFRVNDE